MKHIGIATLAAICAYGAVQAETISADRIRAVTGKVDKAAIIANSAGTENWLSPWPPNACRLSTGEAIWTYDPQVPRDYAYKGCCGVVNRGVALYAGKVFVGTYPHLRRRRPVCRQSEQGLQSGKPSLVFSGSEQVVPSAPVGQPPGRGADTGRAARLDDPGARAETLSLPRQ